MICTWGATRRFAPSDLSNLAAWYRFGQGIAVTGAGVSQWDDASGNGRHLLQGTDANRPPLQGDNTILFDGAGDFLQTGAFVISTCTIYTLFRQVTWTSNDYVHDGRSSNTAVLAQTNAGASPQIRVQNSGGVLSSSSDLAVGTYGAVAAVFDGASSVMQVNNNTPITGTTNTLAMGGFTLGAVGAGSGSYGNIQVKEVIIYSAAHDAATRAQVIAYLNAL